MRKPDPDEIVDAEYRDKIHAVAQMIDEFINGPLDRQPKKNGFIVAFFPFQEGGRFNYMSNCNREDIVMLLKEMTKRFEGHPEPPVGRS